MSASSPGFKTAERAFQLSETRAISCVKIDLEHETSVCRIEFYGHPKLLAYLRAHGFEMTVDDGEKRKVEKFPCEVEMSRGAHTVHVSGGGIVPLSQTLNIAPDQERCAIEMYLQEKDAVLEITPSQEGKILVNLFGIWEELRREMPVAPFRAYSLKWKAENGGAEKTVEIPELAPGEVRKITLETGGRVVFPGEDEWQEAEKLLKSEDYRKAAEKLREAGEKGHVEAIYQLARLDEQGKGRWFSSDDDALAGYAKIAVPPFDHPGAQFKMGEFHEEGRGGLKRDVKAAVEWYGKAAAQGDPDAMYRLAMISKEGGGGEPMDYPKMIEFLTAAAAKGHVEAQYQLGYCLENGVGVPINVRQAKFWYDKAAEQGHRGARERGKLLENIK